MALSSRLPTPMIVHAGGVTMQQRLLADGHDLFASIFRSLSYDVLVVRHASSSTQTPTARYILRRNRSRLAPARRRRGR
jgi:hypothetical protein